VLDRELRVAAFPTGVAAVKDRDLCVAVLSAGVAARKDVEDRELGVARKDRELGVAARASTFGPAGVATASTSFFFWHL